MKEILFWIIISGVLFLGSLTAFVAGLIKKKRMVVNISVVTLLLFFGCVSWTAFLFVSKATTTLKPRTGNEIYSALFGKTDNKCLKILNYQDQVIPLIDYAISLHFETCPAELKRILQLHNFKAEKQSTKYWNTTGPLADDNWFKPETLGDSVLVFKYDKDEYGNGKTIYSSLDSTKAFCIDILD